MKILRFIFRHIIPISIVVGIVALIFCASAPVSTTRINGLGVDLLASPPQSTEAVNSQLNAIQASEALYVRIEVNWSQIETSEGVYDWSNGIPLDLFFTSAEARDLKSVAVITGYPTYLSGAPGSMDQSQLLKRWKAFIQAAVEQFGDRVDYWQIGDQVNADDASKSLAQADPDFYSKMLRAASRIITRANANDQVWMGALVSATASNCQVNPATFLLKVNAYKGWNAVDVVTYEPQRGAAGPESTPANSVNSRCNSPAVNSASLAAEVQTMQELVNQLGGRPFYVTSLTWNPEELDNLHKDREIDLNTFESDLMVRGSVMLMGSNSIPLVFWQIDPASQPEAVLSMDNLTEVVKGAKSLGQIQGQEGVVQEYRFQKGADYKMLAWRSIDGDFAQAVLFADLPQVSMTAFPLDTLSLDPASGLAIQVTEYGTAMVKLNERPIMFLYTPGNWKDQMKVNIRDQFDLWQVQIRTAIQGGLNNVKTLLLQWLDELLMQAKEGLLDWGKQKIHDILS